MVAAMVAASGSAARALADTWLGTVSNVWDTTTPNWDVGDFGNGDQVLFDDSSTSVFNISVAPAGVSPSGAAGLFFNFSNNKTFTFTGGPIGSFYGTDASFYLDSAGTVVFDNAALYASSYYIQYGTLVVGPNTQLNGPYSRTSSAGQIQSTSTITVDTGGKLLFQPGATLNSYTNAGLALTDSGTVEVASGATITGALVSGSSSSGTVKLDGGGATWISQYSVFSGTLTGSGTYAVTDNPQTGGADYAGAGLSLQTPASLQLTSGSALSSSNGAYITLVGANTGLAGYGAGITAYLSGLGYYGPGSSSKSTAPAGALRGSAGVTNNWLGNVVVPTTVVSGSIPDPTAISGGYGGTLIVSGNISGGDPIAFSPQYNSTTVLAGSNTYTGETRIASTYLSAGTLALGAANAIPAGSGISFAGGGASTFDLAGYSTGTAYLTTRAAGGAGYNAVGTTSYNGANSTNVITNSGSSNATLSDVQTGTMTYAGSINDGASKVALAFAGSGNQILTGSSTFSGGTTISSGTVTAGAAAALGTGTVALGGGTLSLATTSPTNAITNFSTTPFTLNKGAGGNGPSISGSTLTLTDTTAANEANSAFTTTPVALGSKGFTASFNLSFNSPAYVPPTGYVYSGGVTLTLENDPSGAHAVGGSGNGLGYSGIQDSAALEISTRQNLLSLTQTDNNRLGTTLQTDGATTNYSTGYNDVRGTNNPGENYNVTLSYDPSAQTLVETLDGGSSGTSSFFYSHIYTGVNLNSILGTSSPYIGFTGGSGGAASFSVSNFAFNNLTGTTTPTSIANGLTAAAGTSSAISLGTSAGNLGATVGPLTVGQSAALAVSSASSDGTTTPGVLTTPSASIGTGGTLTFASTADAVVQNGVTNAGNIVFDGAGSNTLAGVDGAGTVNVGPLATVNVNNHVNQTAIVSSGSVTLAGSATNVIGQGSGTGTGAGGAATTGGIIGGGTLTVSGTANLYASHISQAVLNIGSSSTVTIADSAAPGNAASVSVLTDLHNSGTLDLKNNTLIINDGTQFAQVQSMLATAYDGGKWDGKGLTSSSAAAQYSAATGTSAYGLAYETGAEVAAARYAAFGTSGSMTVDGQAVASTAVAVKYTLAGDTTLTGQVGLSDFLTVQSNLNGSNTDWSQGNFHYGTGSNGTGLGDLLATQANLNGSAAGNGLHTSAVGTSAITRSLSLTAATTYPIAGSTDLQLVVNTSTGNVSIVNQASTPTAFTAYDIKVLDGSSSVLRVGNPGDAIANEGGTGNPPNTGELVLSDTHVGGANYNANAAAYGSSPALWALELDGENGSGNGFGLAEAGASNITSPTARNPANTVTIPVGGSISLGNIFSTLVGTSQADLSFTWAPENANGGDTTTTYTEAPEYVSSAPEPGSLSLLAIGATGLLGRRRRRA